MTVRSVLVDAINNTFDIDNDLNPVDLKKFWILGASYNRTSKIEPAARSKCGGDFCYRKSMDENKICKPGKLFFFMR